MKTKHISMNPLFLLLAFCCLASAQSPSVLLFGRQNPCDVSPYLIKQDFEGVGYDHCEVWSENGTVDPNYTGVVLQGLQSLRLTEIAGIGAGEVQTALFATNTEVWVYCLMRPVTLQVGAFKAVLGLRDTANVIRWEMTVNASGAVRLASSGVATTVGTMSAGTTYHVWLHYQATVGLDVGFSTDGTRPTSGNNFVQLTDIQGGNACRLEVGRNSGALTCDYVFDKVRVDDAQIGNNPP